jgi:hypothetical protein
MPRFPTVWSKKRGKRTLGNPFAGVAGEVGFYAFLFLVGVFGLSLVLISQFAPERVPEQVPTDALSSNLSSWVFGILSVAAIATGVASLMFRLMRVGASSERRSDLANRARSIEVIAPSGVDTSRLPSVPKGSGITESPGERLAYRLPAEVSEGGIAGPAALALLWNSVWLVLLAVVISGFWYGRHRWILAGMLVPFALIGVWSFRFFLAQLRQKIGVGPTIVELSEHPLQPGGEYRLYVQQMGRLKLRRLTVQMACEEETFYRQGTDVRVERHQAFSQILCRERDVDVDPKAPWEQQLQFDLPDNVMHSFVGTHNAIRWKIVVQGESRPWPSFCRSFPVVVHPPGLPPKRSPR